MSAHESTLPERAKAVVVGAGIVGSSLVWHLADLGWRDIVLLDTGPLPNPGGSTGHASNFIFPVDHSREMTELTRDSIDQYTELGVYTRSGGIEIARTDARMEELGRRMSSSVAWGESSRILTPEEVGEMVPYLDTSQIKGGFFSDDAGVVDSLRAGTLMRERAIDLGALVVSANTEVTDVEVEDGAVRAVVTTRGRVETEYLFVACGVWSPRLARMAGATIPLAPAVHQMISVGPIPAFEGLSGEISFPIVRDMDYNMYERQNGSDLEVGSYAHRPILIDADEIPSIEESALSPTELPFTADDFDPQMEQALELMPDAVGAEGAGIRHAINGLLSLTSDGLPVLGETEVRKLWSVAAIWIKEAPGVARAVAQWAVDGQSEIDLFAADVSRFHPHQREDAFTFARASESFNKTYGIVHPAEPFESARQQRRSPFYDRAAVLGAVFYETAGWERPWWYSSNASLLEEYGDRVMDRPAEWDRRWWSKIINAEHLAMRDRAAMFDLSAFHVIEVEGPGALDYVQEMALAQMDVEDGRVVYTPILDPRGGFRADLTIMRIARERFRIVTGGAYGMRDVRWFSDHLPADGSVTLRDDTNEWATLGLWGPRARDVLQGATSDDVTDEGLRFGRFKHVEIAGRDVIASRISYVGELGWELYIRPDDGEAVWDALYEAGRPHGVIPSGIGVYGTTGRLEKCYRAFGAELLGDFNVVEAGMARPRVKEQGFIGKEAHLRHRDETLAATLCTLRVEDHASRAGVKRYMLGGEPILTKAGERILDARRRPSFVTSAGSAPSLGAHLLMAYLPPERAVAGDELLVRYLDEDYPVTIAGVGSAPLLDPENLRVRG